MIWVDITVIALVIVVLVCTCVCYISDGCGDRNKTYWVKETTYMSYGPNKKEEVEYFDTCCGKKKTGRTR